MRPRCSSGANRGKKHLESNEAAPHSVLAPRSVPSTEDSEHSPKEAAQGTREMTQEEAPMPLFASPSKEPSDDASGQMEEQLPVEEGEGSTRVPSSGAVVLKAAVCVFLLRCLPGLLRRLLQLLRDTSGPSGERQSVALAPVKARRRPAQVPLPCWGDVWVRYAGTCPKDRRVALLLDRGVLAWHGPLVQVSNSTCAVGGNSTTEVPVWSGQWEAVQGFMQAAGVRALERASAPVTLPIAAIPLLVMFGAGSALLVAAAVRRFLGRASSDPLLVL